MHMTIEQFLVAIHGTEESALMLAKDTTEQAVFVETLKEKNILYRAIDAGGSFSETYETLCEPILARHPQTPPVYIITKEVLRETATAGFDILSRVGLVYQS